MTVGRDFARVTRAFFSSAAVSRAIDARTRRVLAKFGAYVRRAAQTSMRPAPTVVGPRGPVEATAKPGKPPYTHGRRLLRRLLFFSYDAGRKSVVIGPVRLAETALRRVPRLQEEGGWASRPGQGGGNARYAPHPYMKPAFDRNIGWVAAEYRKAR